MRVSRHPWYTVTEQLQNWNHPCSPDVVNPTVIPRSVGSLAIPRRLKRHWLYEGGWNVIGYTKEAETSLAIPRRPKSLWLYQGGWNVLGYTKEAEKSLVIPRRLKRPWLYQGGWNLLGYAKEPTVAAVALFTDRETWCTAVLSNGQWCIVSLNPVVGPPVTSLQFLWNVY